MSSPDTTLPALKRGLTPLSSAECEKMKDMKWDDATKACVKKYAISIAWLMAVQAVFCELVSKREFPVTREKTGNFSQNRGFRARDVGEKQR